MYMPYTVSDVFVEGTVDYLHHVVLTREQSSFQPYIKSSDLLRASFGGSGCYQALALSLHEQMVRALPFGPHALTPPKPLEIWTFCIYHKTVSKITSVRALSESLSIRNAI